MIEPRDQSVRRTAIAATDRTLLLEASAGTGKTTTLVRRIVQLLFDGLSLAEIVAVTFTEKAALEMKDRLRGDLEKLLMLAPERLDPEQAAHVRRALRELPSAQISTIHSFCSRILRERPVEAELDPGFVAVEEAATRELLDEAFEEWIDAGARDGASPVAAALRAGFAPAALRELAGKVYRERLALDGAGLSRDALGDVHAEIDGLRLRTERLLRSLPDAAKGDAKALQLRELGAALGGLRPLPLDALDGAAGTLPALSLAKGKRNLLDPAQKEAWEALKDEVDALKDRLATVADEPVLAAAAGSLVDGFLPAVARRKQAISAVDFDDLLLRARDLVRHSQPAREELRRRMKTILVDEFQDTDPVQAEVVLRLAGEEPQDPTEDGVPEPLPGALFLVGDPKQAIYRFRRGDVETYRDVHDTLPPEDALRLTTSFRATPALIAYFNEVFDEVFASHDEKWEVEPSPLEPGPEAVDGAGPAVTYLVPPPPVAAGAGGGDDEAPKVQEARAVVNLVRTRLVPDGKGYGKVAVLVYRNDAIDLFQEAFAAAGIPAVLEGGSSFYKREETAAVVRALRAVDAPEDGIATVAALKSFLFGLTDVELLEAAEAGVRFDGLDGVPEGSPLAPAAALLCRLRAQRHARPVAATMADLLDSCQAFAAAEAGALSYPVQALANLERLLAEARALDAEGLGFAEAVGRLTDALEEKAAEPRGFEESEDAVRILTIHKAKGLEFETVVVADLGFKDVNRGGPERLLYDRVHGHYGVALPCRGATVRTPGFRPLEEADARRARAEEKRLLYVAMTRAKRRLVVSWFRKVTVKRDGSLSDTIGSTLLAPIAFAEDASLFPGLVEAVDADVTAAAAATPAAAPAAPASAAAADDASFDDLAAAESLLEKVRTSGRRALRRAGDKGHRPLPVAAEDLPVPERDEEEGPSRAKRLGVTVHAAMELLLAPDGAAPAAAACLSNDPRAAAAAALAHLAEPPGPGERDEAGGLVARLLAHPVVARAHAARRRFTELPVLYRDVDQPDAPLVEGKIDLLFEEEDGWVIVDWKTDRVDAPGRLEERKALYAPQLESYAKALGAVLGPSTRVKEKLLVFARE